MVAKLAVPSRCLRFAEGALDGAESLVRKLRESDAVQPVRLDRPDDVLLDGNGLVRGKLRLTTHALSQLCGLLAPGLSQLVADLAGLSSRGSETAESAGLAIRLVNALVSLRFEERLAGRGMILDHGGGRVEGLVGPKYRFYANTELYSRAERFAATQSQPAGFWRASLSGRRLSVGFLVRRPLFIRGRTAYHLGWQLVNSEIGDTALLGCVSLVDVEAGTAALWDLVSVIHTQGQQFDARLEALFERLGSAIKGVDAKAMIAAMSSLSKATLAVDDAEDGSAREELIKRLCGQSGGARLSLSKDVAEAVVGALVERAPGGPGRKPSRLDLYQTLGTIAARLAPRQQEAAERVAGRLLCKRVG